MTPLLSIALALTLPLDAEAGRCKPSRCDADGDGLTDAVEATLGTNPLSADTDGDGLGDGAEHLVHHTDPRVADTDSDGLTDGEELTVYGTAPLVDDTDGDGIPDGDEVEVTGTDPRLADTDLDGADDAVDAFPLDGGDWADADCDGIGDNADPDDDADGADDALEVVGGTAIVDLAGSPVVVELIVCDWDLIGPVSLSNPQCGGYTMDLFDDGTVVDQGTGTVGEWAEAVDLQGSHTFELGFPSLALASMRLNGVRVAPSGGAQACYDGWTEARGGSSTGAFWWFEVGRFHGCVL